MNYYGESPAVLKQFQINCPEMMFYQYLPIKMRSEVIPQYEKRLKVFDEIVGAICCDFIGVFGLDKFKDSYVYLTAKHMYQSGNCSYNRPGYHSDGFMTEDINYIWCNRNPTIFNHGPFTLTQDDKMSLVEMQHQADILNDFKYQPEVLLRLNQYCIHKVADKQEPGMRTFLKISFSKDKYDLIGNSHNYNIGYNWEMKERKEERNIPQSNLLPFTI